MLMLDLCCGMGGASAAMLARGWEVWRVDVDLGFPANVVADVRAWSWDGERPDLVWASPPCTEFTRAAQPWRRLGREPDLSIAVAVVDIIMDANPRYWVVENVCAARRWLDPILGPPTMRIGFYMLWGWFPEIEVESPPRKMSCSGTQPWRRSYIPWTISEALACAVEAGRAPLPHGVTRSVPHRARGARGYERLRA